MTDKKEVTIKETASKVRTGSEIAPQPKPRVETEKDGAVPYLLLYVQQRRT